MIPRVDIAVIGLQPQGGNGVFCALPDYTAPGEPESFERNGARFGRLRGR
jgi:hypothetical protein